MDLARIVREKQNRVRAPWILGGAKTYFKDQTGLAALIEPLVIALRWSGEYQQLIENMPHFSDTLELTDFLNIMASIGYVSEMMSVNIKRISPQLFPCLFLPYDKSDPMIILGYENKAISIVEACEGSQTLIDKVSKRGIIVHFSEYKVDERQDKAKRESFKSNIARFKGLIIQLFFLSFVHNLFIAVVPIYIMLVYDKVIPSGSTSMLISFLIGVIIFVASAQFIHASRTRMLAYIGTRLDKTLGESILAHLLYLPPTYTENNTVGNQVSRLKDFENIRDFFTSPIALMICELPFTLIFVGIIAMLGGWLAIVPLVLAVMFFALYYVANPFIIESIKRQASQKVKNQSFLLEAFYHIRDIKETGRLKVWSVKYRDMLVNFSAANFEQVFYSSTLSIISDLLMMLAGLLMLASGAYAAMHNNLSMGVLIAIMMLTWKILSPLKSFFSSLPKIEQIGSSISQVNKLFSIPTERIEKKILLPDDTQKAKVEFNRVTYKYKPDANPAILGASFIATPGEIICVTGKNSSGKSTLLRLILGLYKPQTGTISINDKNLQQFDPVEYRMAIAYMPQHVDLFFGTIKQNIMFGNMTADMSNLEFATRLADVYQEIMELPDKFDTHLGDHCEHSFSASFIQKIALARTYLTKSSIMLFDEPSTSLDEHSDVKFIKAIKYLKNESTIFLVTHRPSHLKIADKIIYMQNGQIALFGPSKGVLQRMPQNFHAGGKKK